MRFIPRIMLAFCLMTAMPWHALAAESFVFVKNAKNPNASIKAADVKAIFDGEMSEWKDAGDVYIVLRKGETPELNWVAKKFFNVPGAVLFKSLKQRAFFHQIRVLQAQSPKEALDLVGKEKGAFTVLPAEQIPTPLPATVVTLQLSE